MKGLCLLSLHSSIHWQPHWQPRAIIAALLFAAAGFFVAPAIRAFRHAATTVNPVGTETVTTLVTGGIYRSTRNPMYVALVLLLTTRAAWLRQLLPLLGPVASVAFITRFQIILEERALARRFDNASTDSARSVRRWL